MSRLIRHLSVRQFVAGKVAIVAFFRQGAVAAAFEGVQYGKA